MELHLRQVAFITVSKGFGWISIFFTSQFLIVNKTKFWSKKTGENGIKKKYIQLVCENGSFSIQSFNQPGGGEPKIWPTSYGEK